MNITAFLKENHSKLKTTQKLKVRDLDKIDAFSTVAYVDDKNESYDVKIVIDSRKNIIDTICDCQEGGICNHVFALVLHISESKTEKTLKKPRAKKLTDTDILLNSLDNENLRFWLSEVLNTNKELAFLFKNQFEVKQQDFDTDFIEKIIKESLQSVIGKRRKIETAEVKKIVDALTLASKELLEHLCFAPITDEKYKLTLFLIEKLEAIHYEYQINSIKINRFIESILADLIKNLFTLKDIDVWEQSVKFYFSKIFQEKFLTHEFEQCQKIYEFSKINKNQENYIVQFIEQNVEVNFEQSKLHYYDYGHEMTTFIFKIFTENNLFHKHANKFRPRLFQNDYNIKLLDALMELQYYDSVEVYCTEIIERNYQEKYNVPYIRFLVAIYKSNNENEKLAKLYSVYGKFIYDIKVYNFIKENLPVDEFKKYRMSAFSHARNSYQSGDLEAFNFYFEIKKLDEKQDDLFEMLKNSRNISFLNKYKEIAFGINENLLIGTLLSFDYNYYDKIEEIESLAQFLVKNVNTEKLKISLKQYSRYSYSGFYKKLTELLN
ncbi:hypothetical protein [Flavobacterium sp. 7A]|uniref:hypothetical protein n=1 Tax=Flavobacterium sp. 7A TaxID=2940571 RepID=UPI002226E55B|nr:hypothetical protein [Flavobacterium sp. 7A]MCW2117787.1 hypothetical protein [Flavobacterium sp. 7A]